MKKVWYCLVFCTAFITPMNRIDATAEPNRTELDQVLDALYECVPQGIYIHINCKPVFADALEDASQIKMVQVLPRFYAAAFFPKKVMLLHKRGDIWWLSNEDDASDTTLSTFLESVGNSHVPTLLISVLKPLSAYLYEQENAAHLSCHLYVLWANTWQIAEFIPNDSVLPGLYAFVQGSLLRVDV